MSIVDWDPLSAQVEQPLPVVGTSRPALTSDLPKSPVTSARMIEKKIRPLEDIAEEDDELDDSPLPPLPKQPLHRLAEVREQQGVTLRNMARRMGKDLKTIRAQEDEYADITLTTLYEWQRVLDVPVADLLSENNDPLSSAVKERAQLVRLMKTATAMLEQNDGVRLKRMVQNLIEQLLEIMPELKEVGPWHTVGQRRTMNDVGRCGEQTVPDDFYRRAQN